ncbi:unnamed protein product [Rotaria sp. Silwood2]|nr:unnamed protein product [Rotaria sp. Silwood2]
MPTATTATTTQEPATHNIPVNATWSRIGVTVAGGNGYGGALNQFYYLRGFLADDDQTLVVADWNNNRIVEWQVGASEGKVIAGGNGQGSRLDQVVFATDVLLDSTTNSNGLSSHTDNSYSFFFILATHNIPVNATWSRVGVTVAGGNGYGGALNQFYYLCGFLADNDQTLIVADWNNNRIVEWQVGASEGKVIAGGNGQGSRLDQVVFATDVLLDSTTNSVIICEDRNRRVVRWSRNPGTMQGELLLDDIFCEGLAMDEERNLYVTDILESEVRRYALGSKNGTLVAGGHRRGIGKNQFNNPASLFVDRQQTVYVSDKENHRVMKWEKGATEGVVVAGNNGDGNTLKQLSYAGGLFVDSIGTVYVTDIRNHRVMRWPKGAQQGTVIVGGNGEGDAADQLARPTSISFDKRGNLYVFDSGNQRIQRFSIEDTN